MKHTAKKQRTPRRGLNSVCLHGSRKGIGLCGLSWAFFFFFILSSFLNIFPGEGKEEKKEMVMDSSS